MQEELLKADIKEEKCVEQALQHHKRLWAEYKQKGSDRSFFDYLHTFEDYDFC